MIIRTSSKFRKNYKRLPKKIKEKAKEKELIFRKNPFDLQLNTHKLSGKEKECWVFWIDYNFRIKFIFLTDKEVLFLDIRTPDIYK
ncbi:MAG: type II toxin-antitoxin system mRNA interferase toxin, RelE/StbE family [Patescibacteria group bacterium]|nr:type II toxin-antitoxin system mRNA interferase toxin, RelE/StbE family [Patescibacteria group bacterium]